MQKRTPKKIYKASNNYFIDCEDKHSLLGVFIVVGEDTYWGWVDGVPTDANEVSWLELLVVAGVSKETIEEIVGNDMSLYAINEHLKNKH